METLYQPPIFCDHCPTLALAMLDIAPLCEKCLKTAVDQSTDSGIFEQIKPLVFRPPVHTGVPI